MIRKGIIGLLICFATLYTVAQDTTAPILHNVYVFPTIVNAGDSITVTVEITDDISGIKGVGFPNGGPFGTNAYLQHSSHTHWIPFSEWIHISGDRYKSTVFIPNEVSGGTWEVGGVHAIDLAGNEKYYRDSIDFTARFTVNSLFVVYLLLQSLHHLN
jgi:hypothetical protein